jgi:hypothetical protein
VAIDAKLPVHRLRLEAGGFYRGVVMSKQTHAHHPIYNLSPMEIGGFDSLSELALDLHWSWDHSADEEQMIARSVCIVLGLGMAGEIIPGDPL